MSDPRPSLRDSGPDPADRVAAELEAIRQRAETGSMRQVVTDDVPRLLAIARAALGLALDWQQQAAVMERAVDVDDPGVWNEHAREVREAISRALLGPETTSAEMEG